MKFTALFLIPAAAASAAEVVPGRVPMRDAATHDQIVEATAQARKETPPPEFIPAEGPDPSVVNRPEDLISRSQIFSLQGKATLIPKRALLHLPKTLESRTVMKEGDRFVTWMQFFHANRSWIRTVAVSRAQAEGLEPLKEEVLKSFEKETRAVVATYLEGPISVVPPPPEPEESPEPATDTSTAATTPASR